MNRGTEKNELFQASHLTILISYTIFSAILITESLILGWEIWALLLIVLAVAFSWAVHIQQLIPDRIRLWIYSILMMCTYFFYGIHQTSTFDLATVMSAVIILFTMTGIKEMIYVCQVMYFVTMGYDIIVMIIDGETFDALVITRTLMHFGMIIMIGRIAIMIIDKWLTVLDRSRREIDQLTDSTERLNDFLANVSHEIRTPINAVIGLSEICADKEQNEDLRTDMLSVNAAGRRVAEQISDILDYSEIDRGMLAKNEEDYMLASVLNDIANEVRPYKPDHIELIIDVDPAIPSVMRTDIGKLKKILRHLIMNGLKYTKEGGVYTRISALKEDYGVNLCIDVTDTGIGMTEEEMERISERFYQANSGRARSSSGLGLGMAIVSGFVASLGGFMTVKSTIGKGTTVHVSLPQKVIDDAGCMSIANRDKLCLGAFLHFEKFGKPEVREYYNATVRNIVNGLGVQMHRVDNAVNLNKLLGTVNLTHLFVAEEEYRENKALMERIAKKITVVVVANSSFRLPSDSRARIMEKPFYCFPVAAILNESSGIADSESGRMMCRGVRALVVDDEAMNLTVAKSVFGRYGMSVFTAASGQESIDMCKENKYDIVFMDHMMPGMDGVEAMKQIRSETHRIRNDMPIVALTANAVSTAREMFMSEGFDGFVSKPIELVELERVLKKVLPPSMITYEIEQTQTEPEAEDARPAEESAAAVSDPYEILENGGIETGTGLMYCMNDDDFYKEMLLQFASDHAAKSAAIEKHRADMELRKYEVLVHGLKSTSKTIGCINLSEGAKQLEFAAKENRPDYITEHHAEVMEQYRSVRDVIYAAYGIKNSDDGDSGAAVSAPDGAAETDDEAIEFAPEGEEEIIEFAPENGE